MDGYALKTIEDLYFMVENILEMVSISFVRLLRRCLK